MFVVDPDAALQTAPRELLVNVTQNAPSHQQQGTCFDRNIATTDSDSVDTDNLAEIGGVARHSLSRRQPRRSPPCIIITGRSRTAGTSSTSIIVLPTVSLKFHTALLAQI